MLMARWQIAMEPVVIKICKHTQETILLRSASLSCAQIFLGLRVCVCVCESSGTFIASLYLHTNGETAQMMSSPVMKDSRVSPLVTLAAVTEEKHGEQCRT